MLTKIIKRDGREVAFDRVKIADAIYKAHRYWAATTMKWHRIWQRR